jgi:outer membrane immunogenic protein
MRKLICAAAGLSLFADLAAAADLPVKPVYTKAPPAPVVAVYDWTGLYVGGHLGWGWVDETPTLVGIGGAGVLTVPLGFQVNGNRNGFLGGGQFGANWEFNSFVFGVEGDVSGTDSRVSVTNPGTLVIGSSNTENSNDHWYATATGRVGYAWNTWLLYAKGGAAWMNVNYNGSVTSPRGNITLYPGLTDTRDGWTAGVGVEQAFAPNWSWKLEYDHMDFGSKQYVFVDTTGISLNTFSIKTTVDVVKAGVNYKFYDWNGAAVAAKY